MKCLFSMHHLYWYYSKIKFIVHLNHHCFLFCLKLKEPSKFYVPINCVYPTMHIWHGSLSITTKSIYVFQVKPIQIHCLSPSPLLSIAEEAIFDHCVLGQIPTSWLKSIHFIMKILFINVYKLLNSIHASVWRFKHDRSWHAPKWSI